MLSTEHAKNVLSKECISAVEKFQMIMMEKEHYLAFHVRVGIPMSLDAATTSPVELIYRNIKEKWDVIPTTT
jgi:hypothetical protein